MNFLNGFFDFFKIISLNLYKKMVVVVNYRYVNDLQQQLYYMEDV